MTYVNINDLNFEKLTTDSWAAFDADGELVETFFGNWSVEQMRYAFTIANAAWYCGLKEGNEEKAAEIRRVLGIPTGEKE